MTARAYGWKADRPDDRDFLLRAPTELLPAHLDLRPQMPPVYDQGALGSCTANAIGAAHQYEQIRQKARAPFTPSRLFIYWNERAVEGTIGEDAGAAIRDGIKVTASLGVPPESLWPYDIAKFTKRPSLKARCAAAKHKITRYQRVAQTEGALMAALAAGRPVVFGFHVYAGFESAQTATTGVVDMPKPGEQFLGGHAVVLVGYDLPARRFIVRNSWGVSWGQAGYFTMPFEYVTSTHLASDFWTVDVVAV